MEFKKCSENEKKKLWNRLKFKFSSDLWKRIKIPRSSMKRFFFFFVMNNIYGPERIDTTFWISSDEFRRKCYEVRYTAGLESIDYSRDWEFNLCGAVAPGHRYLGIAPLSEAYALLNTFAKRWKMDVSIAKFD